MRKAMRKTRMSAGLFAALLGLPASGVSQQPQEPPPGQAQTIRREVNLVNIFATVRDKNKRIVPDLKTDDFRVLEDNQQQKIAFFSKESNLPITLGLLIDTSGSEERRLGAEQEAASRFLDRFLRKGDEAMVISFGADVDLLSDFTEDRAQLDRAIRNARLNVPNASLTNPGPLPPNSPARGLRGTAFYDAVYLACSEKLTQEAGRKALVIVTDAQDEGSKTSLLEAIEAAQRNDTVVHILWVHDYGYGRFDVAKKITEETGGRAIEVSSEKHLQEAFDQISDELRTQYTLGFYPPGEERDGKFHKVKVETVNKDYKVLARKGFYAPKS